MKGVWQTIQWKVCSPEREALLCPARRRACIGRVRGELNGRPDKERLVADIIELTRQNGRYGYPLPGRVSRSDVPRGSDRRAAERCWLGCQRQAG